jgi:hypothetical protein
MGSERMNNPVNHKSIVVFGLLTTAALALGFVWIYGEDGFNWSAVIICATIAFFFLSMTVGRLEFIERPREVELSTSGIVLHQRLGRRSVHLPWSAMQKLNIPPSKPSIMGWNTNNCYLFVTEKKAYTLDRKIAEAVMDRYRSVTGRHMVNEYAATTLRDSDSGLSNKH